jgi:hypothetical protein
LTNTVHNVFCMQVRILNTTKGTVMKSIKKRLAYLRKEIIAERISYAEIAELESLSEYIDKGDTLLLEWAGVPEF